MKKIKYISTFLILILISGNIFCQLTINGTSQICAGANQVKYWLTGNTSSIGYTWSLPSGASIYSGQGTSAIYVNFSSTASSGAIYVSGNSQSTGYSVTVSKTAASQGLISGPVTVCAGQTGVIYSVSKTANQISWAVTNGGIITSGHGSSTIYVNYPANYTNGTVVAQGINSPCGPGPASTLNISVSGTIPAKPGTITSSASSSITPGQTGVTFSVAAVSGATSYVWTLPNGASYASGTNPSSNSITVNFSGSFTGGAIGVKASNGTCAGEASSLNLTLSYAVGTPTLSSNPAICTGTTGTTYTYTVNIPNATSYYWTFSGGIYPSGNTNLSTVTVNFPATLSNPSTCAITVYGSNSYGNGPSATFPIPVYKPAGTLGLIYGPKYVTPRQTNITYTINQVADVSNYVWVLPDGVSTTNSTPTSRTISIPANFISGTISITAINGACGGGSPSNFIVSTSPNGKRVEDETDKNYIISRTVLKDNISTESDVEALSIDGVQESVVYYDGLGRPYQSVITGGSTKVRDIIQPFAYDELGREPIKYLPYVDLDGGALYRPDALKADYLSSDQFKFYSNGFGNAPDATNEITEGNQYVYTQPLNEERNITVPSSVVLKTGFSSNGYNLTIKIDPSVSVSDDAIEEKIKPYAVTVFEPSPLDRVLEQGAPGYDWQPSDNSGSSTAHTTKLEYSFNSASEILLLGVNDAGQLVNSEGEYIDGKYHYYANELIKTIIKNENWELSSGKKFTTEEFKNKSGQVVVKRSYNDDETTVETYYVYDDMARLRYVISSEAINKLTFPADKNNSIVKQLCYYYEYDSKQRMIEKQIPGTEPVYMIYDELDRLILTQDGNSRKNADGTLKNQWQFAKYDIHNRLVMNGLVIISDKTLPQIRDAFVTYTGTLSETPTNIGNIGYTMNSFNTIFPIAEKDVLTVTYYDNYSFTGVNGFSTLTFDAPHAYNQVKFDRLSGLETGKRVKVLDGNELTTNATWLNSINYYDQYYRVIQTRNDLYNGANAGKETVSNLYDFSGKVLRNKQSQTFTNTVTVQKWFTYDHAGRLTKTEQEVNNSYHYTISQLDYNELGQLKTKKLCNAVQQVDYAYNIRGWLTKINDPDNMGSDLFAMKLLYNNNSGIQGLSSAQQFNGNISGMVINRRNDANSTTNTYYGYGFTYDNLSRLVSSDYGESAGFAASKGKFNEFGLVYDNNGNILNLKRNNSSGLIDNLSYTYLNDNQSNQLQGVTDVSQNVAGFNDVTGTDYAYDFNGNLTKENNKGFSSISYNYLNLPYVLSKDANNKIRYIYDATGVKLCKEATIGGSTTKRYYCNAYEYDNTQTLSLIHFDEGLVEITSFSGNIPICNHEFYLKDHLGNSRIVFNTAGALKQRTDYYPFGLTADQYSSSTDNKYLYNGKELQQELALDWYDYGARFYDPVIGRWHSVDNKAEKYYNYTPYCYAASNPILYIDRDGRDIYIYYVGPKSRAGFLLGHTAIGASLQNTKIAYFPASGSVAHWYQDKELDQYGESVVDGRWRIDEEKTMREYADQGEYIVRMRFKLPKEVEEFIYSSIDDWIRSGGANPFGNGSWCTLQVKAVIRDALIAEGYTEEQADELIELMVPYNMPERPTKKEMAKSGVIEYTTFYNDKNGKFTSETNTVEQDNRKAEKAKELLNNASNLEAGTYYWDGSNWVRK